jgi:predicted membrane channel-forming protein YqfA (hemolysin III family)
MKHEAPAYMRDNEYLLRGYRIGFNNTKKTLKTLFMSHNETVNVWTHILGVFVFIGLIVYTTVYMAPPGHLNPAPGSLASRWLYDSTAMQSHAASRLDEFLTQIRNISNDSISDRDYNSTINKES